MELKDIKGVGEKIAEKLNSLGIYSTLDLCRFLPTNYIDMSKSTPIEELVEGEYSLIKVICTECNLCRAKSHMQYVKAICVANGIRVEIVWFNMPYIAKAFTRGEWLVWGKFTIEKGIITAINPSYASVENKYKLHDIMPIYPLKGIIGEITFRKIMEKALAGAEITSTMPHRYNLNHLYQSVHFPKNINEVWATHHQLAQYNIVLDLLLYRISRLRIKSTCEINCNVTQDMLSALPYRLTESQTTALDEIIADINNTDAMNRLVLGDVGSGKTIVALLAMKAVANADKLSILMCPTEILCIQHYNNAIRLFGVENTAILLGSMTKKEKIETINSIHCGKIKILFATQSCISDNMEYKDLGLIIIDESHKFGVNQKGMLENKGNGVNSLIMSATPLPRSIAMTLYDDLSISKIERRSENVDNIKSYIFNSNKLAEMYTYITQKVNNGDKVYLICPRLNDGDGKEIYAVKSVYKLIVENYLAKDKVAMLYGGVKEIERDRIMQEFTSGGVNLLIATTVVEVGVDVPQANTMVILASDCFGLATLHQLRGRIGRNGGSAECFLHTRSIKPPSRITAIKECNDGIRLAEIDADERGYGDIIGAKQSGGNKYEHFLCKVTMDMIREAKTIADEISTEEIDIKNILDQNKDINQQLINVVLN